MTHPFIAAAREAVPGISNAEIARRITVSKQAVGRGEFSASRAVAAWNALAEVKGHPVLVYVAAVVRVVR